MSKPRDMRRTDWQCITRRKYISQTNRDIFGSAGTVSLLRMEEVKEPFYVRYRSQDICIARQGYSWLQAAVPCARWWMTAMFDGQNRLIQIYFDITDGNSFACPDNPEFEDMYVDIVLSADGSLEMLDLDELDDALKNGTITSEQYRQAAKEGYSLLEYLKSHAPQVTAWSRNNQRELLNLLKTQDSP